MCRFTVVMLLVPFVHGQSPALTATHTGSATDSMDGFVDRLFGPMLDASTLQHADLETSTLGKEHKDAKDAVSSGFPGSMSGKEMFQKVIKALNSYGVKPSTSIYGQSLCSDEINGDAGHISVLLSKYFGRTFQMGGIGGAPYVGKTGFGAFAAHVPEGGDVVVLFGPHVGITSSGEIGKFLRDGQSKPSTSCGAAIAAYSQCQGAAMGADEKDLEQSWIRQKLKPKIGAVKVSNEPMAELSKQMYKCVEEEMLSIINTKYGPGKLILIGGVQINMPYPSSGYFLPLHFSVRSASMQPEDLMNTFSE